MRSYSEYYYFPVHYESMWYDFSGGKEIEIFLCYSFPFNMEYGGLTSFCPACWVYCPGQSPFKPGHGRKLCPVPQSVVNNPGPGAVLLANLSVFIWPLLLGILEFRMALVLKKSLV